MLLMVLIAASASPSLSGIQLGMTRQQLQHLLGYHLRSTALEQTIQRPLILGGDRYGSLMLRLAGNGRLSQYRLDAAGRRNCERISRHLHWRMGKPSEADLNGDHGYYGWLRRMRPIRVEYRDFWRVGRKGASGHTCWVTVK